jgi:hypothetical protein
MNEVDGLSLLFMHLIRVPLQFLSLLFNCLQELLEKVVLSLRLFIFLLLVFEGVHFDLKLFLEL